MLKIIFKDNENYKLLDTSNNAVYFVSKVNTNLLVNLGVQIAGLKSTNKLKKYAFVKDSRGVVLSPTKEEKAWYLIRHNRAKLLSLNPMQIQLLREQDNTDNSKMKVGIDPGDTTGLSIVQECEAKNKVIAKSKIHHRKDVKKLVEQRRNYRRLRRSEKRYRPARFNNRASSRREGRVAPSIKNKKDEILRVIKYFNKLVNINDIYCEDVSFDIRALSDGYKPYKWKYQKSNRLDENIRKAVIMRDGCKCMMCGIKNTVLEVHHITPRRQNGSNTLSNLITLCHDCHSKITGKEDKYKNLLYSKISVNNNSGIKPAMHVMQGKSYLYKQLSSIADLYLTTGGDTSNKRIDWGIKKTHSNDAVCITDCKVNNLDTLVYEYTIKPRRKKSRVKKRYFELYYKAWRFS